MPNPHSNDASLQFRCPNDETARVSFDSIAADKVTERRASYVGNRGWKDQANALFNVNRGPFSIYYGDGKWRDVTTPENTIFVAEFMPQSGSIIYLGGIDSYKEDGQGVVGEEYVIVNQFVKRPHAMNQSNFLFGDNHVEYLDTSKTLRPGNQAKNGSFPGIGEENMWRMHR
jgi:prepilin-type processing-associated H-X9-DG protein